MKKTAILIILLIAFLYWQNNDTVTTTINIKSNQIPNNFNDYKILQISDLHNKEFGKNQSKLIHKTKDLSPDIIVITGDIIDSRRTNINKAINYIKEAKKIAPIYYVPGNHESRIKDYNILKKSLLEEGVIVLDNKIKNIKIDKEEISILGVNDISFIKSNTPRGDFVKEIKTLKEKAKNNFTILLSHRPDLIHLYAKENIDLVFSGHAHGGQIRLPFIKGIIAPHQGLFPKYTDGLYESNNTKMIVSRGLGNSLFPFRIFNRPQLILTTIKSANILR